jgi:hypothetical protein
MTACPPLHRVAASIATLFALALIAKAEPALPAAGEHRAAAVTDTLPGRPDVTYRALLAQFMPDLAESAGGVWTTSGIARLRYLSAAGGEADAVPFSFRTVETLALQSDGKPVLLVATDGDAGEGEFSMILAAYDMTAPLPRLIDYVDAGMDRWTALGASFALADGTDAFAVTGWHDNSSESYDGRTLAFLHNGRITGIADLLAYGVRTCAWMTTQESSHDTQPDPGARYNAVVLSITQQTTRQDEDCGEDEKPLAPEGKQTFTDIYRWDETKGAYASATDHLSKALGPE